MTMLAMTILVRFFAILGRWTIYTHPEVQPAAIYCSLATWAILGQPACYPGARTVVVGFVCPNRA